MCIVDCIYTVSGQKPLYNYTKVSNSVISCVFRIPALKYLGLSASKFIDHRGNTNSSINQYFKNSESVSTSKTCAETSKDNTLASQDKYLSLIHI